MLRMCRTPPIIALSEYLLPQQPRLLRLADAVIVMYPPSPPLFRPIPAYETPSGLNYHVDVRSCCIEARREHSGWNTSRCREGQPQHMQRSMNTPDRRENGS